MTRRKDGFTFKIAFVPDCFDWRPRFIPHYALNFWWFGVNLFFEWNWKHDDEH